jgi:hypothetical protein
MLIKEVFNQFLSEQKSKLVPKTYRDYESVIDLFENQLDDYAWNGIDDGEKAYDEAKKQKKVLLIFTTILILKITLESFY